MIYVCNVPGLIKWDEPNQIQNILDDLESNKNRIIGLELCHNSIGEKCAKALGEKMKNLKNLKKVDLSDCFVTRGSGELPNCLKFLLEAIADKPIKELYLNNNALGPTAAPGYKYFFQKNKTLEKLYLNDCGMGPIGTQILIKIIIENKDMPLKVLKIARNKMESVGLNSISELIKEKKSLKEIKVSDNEINNEALNIFSESIKSNENITLLDINNNIFGEEATILPEIVSNLKNIVHLNISDLTLENKDIIKNVFKELPKLNNLREFFCEYNISDALGDIKKQEDKNNFILELFESLLKINNLKELHLENNEIPKNIYSEYLPKFKNKGLYLFSCYADEEKMDDKNLDNEELDMTDLNK